MLHIFQVPTVHLENKKSTTIKSVYPHLSFVALIPDTHYET